MDNVISIKALTKIYKKQGQSQEKIALNELDLEIPKGVIFGLLGPNGAGKSSLINILAGTVIKTSGIVKIFDSDIDSMPKTARSAIGCVPQEVVIDSFFPLGQSLEFAAGYYGIRPENRKTDQILKALGLFDKKNMLPRQLSGGMKRRFLIARAMVHSPAILVLDEPTAGVDIELREQLWKYIQQLKNEGTTIIITTHYLEEAEELCDYIAFINNGKVIKLDSKDNLLSNLGEKYLDIDFHLPIDQAILSNYHLPFKQLSSNKVRFYFNTNTENFSDILIKIQGLGVDIDNLQLTQLDLESIFKKLIYNKSL